MGDHLEELIDAEIRQLTELKRMAKNPRMVALMRDLVTRSTNGATSETVAIPAQAIRTRAATRTSPPRKSAGARATAPNGLSKAVAEAVKTIKPHFSNSDLADYMVSQGFVFVSNHPRLAVMAPMEKLLKMKIVRISKKGQGSQPNLYEYVGRHEGE